MSTATAYPAWTVNLNAATTFIPANKCKGNRAGYEARFPLKENAFIRWGLQETTFGLSAGQKSKERLEDGSLNPYQPQVGTDGCIVDMGEKDPAQNGNRTVGYEVGEGLGVMYFNAADMNTIVHPDAAVNKETGVLNEGYVSLNNRQVCEIWLDNACKALAANFETVFPASAVPISTRTLPSRDYETVLNFIREHAVFLKAPNDEQQAKGRTNMSSKVLVNETTSGKAAAYYTRISTPDPKAPQTRTIPQLAKYIVPKSMFEPFTTWAVWYNPTHKEIRFFLNAREIFFVPPLERPRAPTSTKDMAASNPAVAALLASMDAERLAALKAAEPAVGMTAPVSTVAPPVVNSHTVDLGGVYGSGGIGSDLPTVTVTEDDDDDDDDDDMDDLS